MAMMVVSVNLGVARAGGDLGRTGIDKRPVTGPVEVTALGLAGDVVIDARHHGGIDQAVYAYAREDAAWWAAELGREIEPGRFGENLSTRGVDLTNAVIGERWTVGSAVLEVSLPRIPCRTFADFWDVPDLIQRFTSRGASGAYLRVLTEGQITAGDPIVVTSRPAHGLTTGETFRALTTEPDLLIRLVDVAELPAKARDRARRRTADQVG